jgi:DNA polymerase-3 subunit epsilon
MCPFDLESSGVNTREARIVTGFVATVMSRARRRAVRPGAQVLINPGVPIPPEATMVHGITDAMAQAKGAPPADGVYAIAKALADALKARMPVVGHNLAYDFSLLYWECLRHGVPTVAEQLGYPPAAAVGPVVDTYVLDKHVDQWRKGSRKLGDDPVKGPGVASHYGVQLTAAHTADADAMAAARVAAIIAERYPDLPTDLVALHQMQKLAPHKQLIAAPPEEESCHCNECPFMRLNTPEKVYLALRDLEPRLEMDADLRERARLPLERMLELSA